MTAEEIFNEKYGKSASILLAYKQDIVKMLTEFATLKCKEQKRICYDGITSDRTGCYDSILYSPMPEM